MTGVNGYETRTYAIEFAVPGALDGVTLSPPVNGAPVAPPDDPQQIFRPEVPGNLGLIDVDYLVEEAESFRRGARGNRLVSWLWIEAGAGAVGAPGAAVQVVDAIDGTVLLQEEIASLAGDSEYYNRRGILVPQGSLLRIVGFPAGATAHKVRLHIQYLDDDQWLEAAKTVCLCDEAGAGGDGPTGATGPTGPTGPGGWDPTDTYWVDAGYTGGNSDGSPDRPFTTIQEAIDLGWIEVSSQAFENYATVIIAPGVYNETALFLYPFVTLVGEDADSTRITSASPIDIFSFGNYNLHNLRFESPFAINMTSVPFFGFFTWFRSWNCRFDADFQVNGLGALNHWFEFHEGYFEGDFDIQNVTWWMADCTVYSANMAVQSAAGAIYPFTGKDGNDYFTGVYLYDGFSTATVVGTQPSGANGTWFEVAGRLFAPMSVDGGGGNILNTVETTADGYPEGGLTLSNGAVQFPSGNALGLLYAAAVPGNWAVPAPDTVGEAIDRLIAATPGA